MTKPLSSQAHSRRITEPAPHFVWPVVDDAMRSAVLRQLDASVSIYNRSGVIARLEDTLQDYYGVKHALTFNSGTSALLALFFAGGLASGDEVVCPAYTFFATASPLFILGARPVLADTLPDGNVDPASVAASITPRTRAVVVTHVWGRPCEMDALADVCRRAKIPLFEDISHAFGARYRGKLTGTFGRGAALSLQGQKTLTAGEGGVLLTDDDDLFYRALSLGHYNKRCRTEIPTDHALAKLAVTGHGLKLRIHPVAAAIALQQFETMPRVLSGRARTAETMHRALSRVSGLKLPEPRDDLACSWYAFAFRLCGPLAGQVDAFVDAAHREGAVEVDHPGSTRPLHNLKLFQRPETAFPHLHFSPAARRRLKGSEAYYRDLVKIPVWHRKEDAALVDGYIDAIKLSAERLAR